MHAEFSPAGPEMWFHIMSNFKAAGTDSTKYAHVVSSLGSRYTAEVRDVIFDSPEKRAYDLIKSELIKRPSSQEHKTRTRRDRGP